MFNFLIIILLS